MACTSYLRVIAYGNSERLVHCARMDADHEVHLDSIKSPGPALTWRDDSPGACRIVVGGPVNRPASRPDAPEVVRHGKCANVVCSNQANEGQMVTFVLPRAIRRSVALILCAPCGDALVRECGG